MFRAATLPAAMARMTVAGPVWQSPPTNTPSSPSARKLSSATKRPHSAAMPNSSKGAVTTFWPTANSTTSASMRLRGLSASTGAGRPRLTVEIICGWVITAQVLPASSASMDTGASRVIISTPSAMALSTSSGSAVMSAKRRR